MNILLGIALSTVVVLYCTYTIRLQAETKRLHMEHRDRCMKRPPESKSGEWRER